MGWVREGEEGGGEVGSGRWDFHQQVESRACRRASDSLPPSLGRPRGAPVVVAATMGHGRGKRGLLGEGRRKKKLSMEREGGR